MPCGVCEGCLRQKERDWSIRIQHEAKLHEHVYFVTLTIDDAHLGDGALHYEVAQKFLRTLSRRCPGMRYVIVGHYGATTMRPHFHAIIFGANLFADHVTRVGGSPDDPQYSSKIIESCWKEGHHRFSHFTPGRAGYTAAYAVAARENRKPFPAARGEFLRASRRPGIGAGWLEKFGESDAFGQGFTIKDGRPTAIPRYYLRKLAEQDPERYEQVKALRLERSGDMAWDGSSDRLAVRAEVASARAGQKKRSL